MQQSTRARACAIIHQQHNSAGKCFTSCSWYFRGLEWNSNPLFNAIHTTISSLAHPNARNPAWKISFNEIVFIFIASDKQKTKARKGHQKIRISFSIFSLIVSRVDTCRGTLYNMYIRRYICKYMYTMLLCDCHAGVRFCKVNSTNIAYFVYVAYD